MLKFKYFHLLAFGSKRSLRVQYRDALSLGLFSTCSKFDSSLIPSISSRGGISKRLNFFLFFPFYNFRFFWPRRRNMGQRYGGGLPGETRAKELYVAVLQTRQNRRPIPAQAHEKWQRRGTDLPCSTTSAADDEIPADGLRHQMSQADFSWRLEPSKWYERVARAKKLHACTLSQSVGRDSKGRYKLT